MSGNRAAVLTDSHSIESLTKQAEISYPKLDNDKVIIKSKAFALNPLDWKLALGIFPGSKPDAVAGSDVSGVVHEVGKNVKGFAAGDIVSAFILGNISLDNGAFADYVVANPKSILKYAPSQIKSEPLLFGDHPSSPVASFEAAASVTLSLGTAIQSFAHNFGLKTHDKQNSDKYVLI